MKVSSLTHNFTLRFWMTVLLFLLFASAAYAQRTDEIVLKNGDTVTGEIKNLARGKLEYKTDNMGTLQIEWEIVDSIQSKNIFDVESISGRHYFGSIEKAAEKGHMVVVTTSASVTLEMLDIVHIYPLESSFWQRIKGFLDVGFSYQKTNDLVEWTLGLDVTHRAEKWQSKLKGSSYFSGRSKVRDTSRNSLNYQLWRVFKKRWAGIAFVQAEQNDELDVALRMNTGIGVARFIVQTNRNIFSGIGGLSVQRERFTGSDEFQTSLEGMLALNYEAFKFFTPQLDFVTSLILLPGLTEWGRIRINFDSRLRYELLKDFYVSMHVFDQFDNHSGVDGTVKNDFGIDLGLSWSFQ